MNPTIQFLVNGPLTGKSSFLVSIKLLYSISSTLCRISKIKFKIFSKVINLKMINLWVAWPFPKLILKTKITDVVLFVTVLFMVFSFIICYFGVWAVLKIAHFSTHNAIRSTFFTDCRRDRLFNHKIWWPSRQILVPRTSLTKSPECPLTILFDLPEDVPIRPPGTSHLTSQGRSNLTLQGHPKLISWDLYW